MYMTHRLLPAAVALIASATLWAGDSPGTFEREVPAPARGVVQISSTNGTVDVSAWDRAAVSVKAELAADVDRVEVTSSGDHTVVRVIQRHSGMSFSNSGHEETHLRVQVPKDSEVDVSTGNRTRGNHTAVFAGKSNCAGMTPMTWSDSPEASMCSFDRSLSAPSSSRHSA